MPGIVHTFFMCCSGLLFTAVADSGWAAIAPRRARAQSTTPAAPPPVLLYHTLKITTHHQRRPPLAVHGNPPPGSIVTAKDLERRTASRAVVVLWIRPGYGRPRPAVRRGRR